MRASFNSTVFIGDYRKYMRTRRQAFFCLG
jgi:hypothetical protein